MNDFFKVYAIVMISSIVIFWSFKIYFESRSLKRFRSNLTPGLEILVEYKGELQPAEIQNMHGGLVFCWLTYYGCFTYVELSNIYPYDYK